jgi:hypothetical protein
LCRRHHRLKTDATAAGWRYVALETGTWLWTDGHGQRFLRDQTGTRDVTPTRRGPPDPHDHFSTAPDAE